MAAAAAPTSISISFRPIMISTSSPPSPSVSLCRSPPSPLPISISIAQSADFAIAASSSGGGIDRLQTLDKYITEGRIGDGWLQIRPMEDDEIDPTVHLLSSSFAESMGLPPRYIPLLAFLIRQYVVGRRFLSPQAVMLLGFYREGDMQPELACTAEISFDLLGDNVAPPTPLPPRDCAYICNMAVKKEFRRYLSLPFLLSLSLI